MVSCVTLISLTRAAPSRPGPSPKAALPVASHGWWGEVGFQHAILRGHRLTSYQPFPCLINGHLREEQKLEFCIASDFSLGVKAQPNGFCILFITPTSRILLYYFKLS